MKLAKCSMLAFLFLAFQAEAVMGEEAEREPLKLVCYAETWALQRDPPMNYNPDNLPDGVCDYLVLQFLTLDSATSTLKMHNGYTEVEPEQLRQLASTRDRSPDMKVLMAVGGWDDGVDKYSDMMADAGRRRAFVESAVDTLNTYDLDGLDLHWMYPGAVWRGGRTDDKENFLLLVKELTRAFKKGRRMLTAHVPPDSAAIADGYLIRRLSSYLHQLHVHTFDMRGDWHGVAENHCPLYARPGEKDNLRYLNMNDSLAMWISRGASPRKLVPTVPLFGRTFTLRDPEKNEPGSPVTGPGKKTRYVKALGIMAYYEVCDELLQEKLVRHFTYSTQTPYAVSGDQWVGYDDEESIRKKVKFMQERGLAGVALYSITMDDFIGTCGQAHFLLHKTKSYLGLS